MAIIDTLFMTKTAENHTLWGRTYLYRPYKGVSPGGFGNAIQRTIKSIFGGAQFAVALE